MNVKLGNVLWLSTFLEMQLAVFAAARDLTLHLVVLLLLANLLNIAADMAIAEQFAAMIPPRQVTIAACVQTTAILLHIVMARMEVIALDVLLLQVKSPILVYNSMILKGSC
mmetsp:Transcript_11286/g.12672  ORF Transcript_11286/g.12672 Transcript_11286/m.12672 type:complete len:112 (-) Transcript_11286:93-428(-)